MKFSFKDEWEFKEAEKMEKPWEVWNNGYTRARKMLWENEQREKGCK